MREGGIPREVLISPLSSSLPPKTEPSYDPNAMTVCLRQVLCPLLAGDGVARFCSVFIDCAMTIKILVARNYQKMKGRLP